MATGQPPRPGLHRFSPSPWASHTLWRQPLPPVCDRHTGGIPNARTREAALHLPMGKARPRVKWPGHMTGLPISAFTECYQELHSRPQPSKPCRVRAQGPDRMWQGRPRVASAAHGSISWETDIPAWACHGLCTSQTLFTSLAHPTPTLQIKELTSQRVSMLLAQETMALSVCAPSPHPSISQQASGAV